MRALIIDDESNCRELLTNMLGIYCQEVSVVAEADGVQAAYKRILEHKPDLIFLDIQMGDGTGFDLLSLFDNLDFKVVFTTAYQEYAVKAFQCSAVDYLLKPISPAYLIKAVNKTKQLLEIQHSNVEVQTLLNNIHQPEKEKKKIIVKTHDRVYAIFVHEIVRCESDGSYTSIFLNNGDKIMVARQLKEFDEMLSDDGFIRVHQSHLINLSYLFYYEKKDNQVIMKDQSQVPVSIRKKEELMAYIQSKK